MNVDVASGVKDTIRQYVTESFLTESEATTIHDDDDLLEVLDSLQILRMAADLADRFSIIIDNGDLTPENFGSVEKLAAFVAGKRQC
jgi:acyl carrier protein